MMSPPASGGPDAAALARSVLFSDWPPDMLATAAVRFRARPVEAGDVICVQGEPGDEMYVVDSGRYSVEASLSGRTTPLAEFGPGAIFGEIAVVTRRPRSATISALTPGLLWALSRSDFQDLVQQRPNLGVVAGRLAAARLLDTERHLANEPQTVLSLQPKQEAVTIGRDEHNDLVLHDPRVSRRHALVRRAGAT
ncbi:MAG: cyclic nucleotide-binding domain-containing protein, partial [Chloroflexota bacterium]